MNTELAEVEPPGTPQAVLRHPGSNDGASVWRLARDTSVLDLNPPYTYALCLDRFSSTCVVATERDDVVGFVMGFRPPEQQDVVFVWQVAVAAASRGDGIATRMLHWLVERNGWVDFVEATVAPDNRASAALFGSLARRYSAPQIVRPHFGSDLFPSEAGPHAPEDLHRIGPIRHR